jgi:hypothetical protein
VDSVAGRCNLPASYLDRQLRRLRAKQVGDALATATAALGEATQDGSGHVEIWRLAAARTSELLDALGSGAASIGHPLPPEATAAVSGLRAWAVITAIHHDPAPGRVLVPRSHLTAVVERRGSVLPLADPRRSASRGQVEPNSLGPGSPASPAARVQQE